MASSINIVDMKTFKQYLLEMPVERPWAASRRYEHSTKPNADPNTKYKGQLGNIGPYEVHHIQDELGSDTVTVLHGGKQIGVFPLVDGGRHNGKKVVSVDKPNIHPSHRGEKAKVSELAANVYGMIADRFGGVISGPTQTKGSRSLWGGLAKMRQVSAVDTSRRKTKIAPIDNYDPKKHDSIVYDDKHGEDIRLVVMGKKKK
jgi:hypothetical protein